MDRIMCHHGIKGQKWGIRRYQNEDGSLTAAGKKRYGVSAGKLGGMERKNSSGTGEKAAIGAAVVVGTVLTAYLVKKYGSTNISDISDKASVGKEVFRDILKTAPVVSAPVSQIPKPKPEAKQALEKAVKSVSSTASRASSGKPFSGIPPASDFGSLMRQNEDLLKKMLAELA